MWSKSWCPRIVLRCFTFLLLWWQVWNHNISDMHGRWPFGYWRSIWAKWRLQNSSGSFRYLDHTIHPELQCMLCWICIGTNLGRLPSAGVTSVQMLQSPDNKIQPDFYTNQISDFLTLKTAAVWTEMWTDCFTWGGPSLLYSNEEITGMVFFFTLICNRETDV